LPSGKGVRVDGAFEEGMEIPIFYDPMIAKLVVWGETREKAIEKCLEAINEYEISGLNTTLDFGKYVLQHPAFRSGDFDTNFIKTYFSDPNSIYEGFQDEAAALEAGVQQIWNDLKKMDEKQFQSQPITGAWVKVP
jgi:propionyl-CoA carboxylase alpha chain